MMKRLENATMLTKLTKPSQKSKLKTANCNVRCGLLELKGRKWKYIVNILMNGVKAAKSVGKSVYNFAELKRRNTHIFEKTYNILTEEANSNAQEPIDTEFVHDFSWALCQMKHGKKIHRAGWNGKGMFAVLQKGYPNGIPCNKQTAEAWGLNEGDLFRCEPYMQLKMVNGSHSMWVPSVNDCLSNDWAIVEG